MKKQNISERKVKNKVIFYLNFASRMLLLLFGKKSMFEQLGLPKWQVEFLVTGIAYDKRILFEPLEPENSVLLGKIEVNKLNLNNQRKEELLFLQQCVTNKGALKYLPGFITTDARDFDPLKDLLKFTYYYIKKLFWRMEKQLASIESVISCQEVKEQAAKMPSCASEIFKKWEKVGINSGLVGSWTYVAGTYLIELASQHFSLFKVLQQEQKEGVKESQRISPLLSTLSKALKEGEKRLEFYENNLRNVEMGLKKTKYRDGMREEQEKFLCKEKVRVHQSRRIIERLAKTIVNFRSQFNKLSSFSGKEDINRYWGYYKGIGLDRMPKTSKKPSTHEIKKQKFWSFIIAEIVEVFRPIIASNKGVTIEEVYSDIGKLFKCIFGELAPSTPDHIKMRYNRFKSKMPRRKRKIAQNLLS